MDWGASCGHVGKTLKEMWHTDRDFVIWAAKKGRDDAEFAAKYVEFFDALDQIRLIRQLSDGRVLFKEKDDWSEYKVSKAVNTKRCGCDAHTGCGRCESEEDDVEQEEDENNDDEDGDESEEEEWDCPECGEPQTGMDYDGTCWDCMMGVQKCEMCKAIMCEQCGNYAHKSTCEALEDSPDERCECNDQGDEDPWNQDEDEEDEDEEDEEDENEEH